MAERRNLQVLDRLGAPDLWPDIDRRRPGPPVSLGPSPLRRAGVALLALAVAGGAVAFAVVAFGGGNHGRPGPAGVVNGEVLVYARPAPEAPVQLFAVPAGGGDARQVTHAPSSVVQAAVSPDGSTIAYADAGSGSGGGDVHAIGWDGTGDRLVCTGCVELQGFGGSAASSGGGSGSGGGSSGISIGAPVSALAFAPDGHLAIASQTGGSGIVMRDGDRVVARDAGGPGIIDGDLAIAPDGSAVAWRRQNPGTGAGTSRKDLDGLYLLDASTGETRRLTTQNGPPFTADPDTEPAWSPDGRWIAYLHGEATFDSKGLETSRTYAVWEVRPDGTDAHAVSAPLPRTAYLVTLAWSADGTRIAYVVIDGRRMELHVVGEDGSDDRTVLRADCLPDEACGPGRGTLRWSPDGRDLVFHGTFLDRQPGTYVVGVDGSGLRRIGGALGDASPVAWLAARS